MALPFQPTFKNYTMSITSTSSGGVELNVTIPYRSKYTSTLVTALTSSGGTSAVDIFYWPCGLGINTGQVTTSVTITSGASVTSSTGHATTEIGSTVTPAIFFNKGDVLTVQASTGISGPLGWTVTHILQEF